MRLWKRPRQAPAPAPLRYVPKAWRAYEAPKPVDQYRYRIEESYEGTPRSTDELYTDDRAEADRILAAMIDDGYPTSRIIDQSNGRMRA